MAGSFLAMEVETAIRTRRTHKAYRPEPVERETLDELLDLARWAPNHHLTNPWRFRVLGPRALERLKQAAGPEAAAKLDRAPTLIVCSCALTGDDVGDEEDLHATAIAAYIVLLAAHARGLAAYWRTPDVLRTAEGAAAVGLGADERFVALIHVGRPVQDKPAPPREPAASVTTYLD
jgi:nitroreductase